jgi:purine nucleosidase
VFSSFPQFTLVDWEATLRHGIAFERMQSWLDADNPRAQFYASISRKTHAWSRERGRPKVLVADALAMAVALKPDLVTRTEERHVAIELTGTHTRGATVVDWESTSGTAANARIVLGVDQARFETLVATALGAA